MLATATPFPITHPFLTARTARERQLFSPSAPKAACPFSIRSAIRKTADLMICAGEQWKPPTTQKGPAWLRQDQIETASVGLQFFILRTWRDAHCSYATS